MTFMILQLLIRITNLLLLIWWYLRVERLVLFVEHTIGRWLLNNSYISLVAHAATRADKEGKAKAFEGGDKKWFLELSQNLSGSRKLSMINQSK